MLPLITLVKLVSLVSGSIRNEKKGFSDGEQFHQYQWNEQSHLTSFLIPNMTMENEVLTLNGHKNVAQAITGNGITKRFFIKNNMSDDLEMYYVLTLVTIFSMKPQKLSIWPKIIKLVYVASPLSSKHVAFRRKSKELT